MKRYYITACLIGFLASPSCRRPVLYQESRMMMGTVLSIELAAPGSGRAADALDACWSEAERLEKIFSRYMPESELNRINREAGLKPVGVSGEMMAVLSRSVEISRLTGGAFDVTVGPLMEIWGFFPQRKGRLPTGEEIGQALSRCGWEKIELDRSGRTVRFRVPGLTIDLGGLAKGYVVDRLAALLVSKGIKSALVNAGGDIYCLGRYPDGRRWRIGMEHPRDDDEVLTVLELSDRAVATSGDYRNYFVRRRKRYSHIIDPRTGRPAGSGVVESSVLAPDCATADALATALFVVGAKDGLKLLGDVEGADGIIVTEEKDRIAVHFSDRLSESRASENAGRAGPADRREIR
ncbi:MAG: FAD:protein FMN transferase [PVC group bacterium]